jgi:uncharacterized protein YndB with AHSA1/START domain
MTEPLVVRRTIRASAEHLFDAWTQPHHLMRWWGPRPVTCAGAEVDLRVGGRYRISNRMPDGQLLWISGAFEHVDRPRKLVYSWSTDPAAVPERITVEFVPAGSLTEVVVTHERIPTEPVRRQHALGWAGCFDSLSEYCGQS